jgi:MFS transporter, DHA1 family, multidrug resistance protein
METERGPAEGSVAEPRIGFRSILADPAVRIVMLAIFVVMLGFGIIAPILPLFARSFGVGYSAAGLLISAFAFTRLIFDLIAGPIVDRWGERLAATGGLLVVAVSSVLTGLAWNFPVAVAFRGAGGAGSSVMFAAVYSYLLRVVPKDRMARTLGVFFGSFNIGFIVGGPLGGLIAHDLGLRSPLFVYAGLCLGSAVLFLRFVTNPERAPTTDDGEQPAAGALLSRTWRAVRELLSSRTFVAVVVLNMAFFWVVAGGYDTLVPLFGQSGLHMSTVGIGAVLAAAVATELVLLYPAGIWADRFGRKALVIPALGWFSVVVAIAGFSPSPILFGLVLALMGIGSGSVAVVPSAMLSDVAPEGRSGTAVGVFRFFGDIGFVFGPLVAGVSTSAFGFKAAFALMAAPLVLSLVLLLRIPETFAFQPER